MLSRAKTAPSRVHPSRKTKIQQDDLEIEEIKDEIAATITSEKASLPDIDEEDNDGEDENIDTLIDELKSIGGQSDTEGPGLSEVCPTVTKSRDCPEVDSNIGLSEDEVAQRRRKYGLNQMKEEKKNLFLNFLSYFVGPVQFVMEVSWPDALA